jgi:hypothetical protein
MLLAAVAVPRNLRLYLEWRTRTRLSSADCHLWPLESAFLILVVAAAISVESAITVFNWVRSDFKYATYLDAHDVLRSYRLLYYDQRWQNFDRAADWIKQEAVPNAVVATGCPHYPYLRAGRKAVMPPMERRSSDGTVAVGRCSRGVSYDRRSDVYGRCRQGRDSRRDTPVSCEMEDGGEHAGLENRGVSEGRQRTAAEHFGSFYLFHLLGAIAD